MNNQFIRSEMLLGSEALEKLHKSKVAVFGIGGVGGYVCEALARVGVGKFLLVDKDTVSLSNINRQIIATHNTVDQYKTTIMKERILSINPNALVEEKICFFLPENSNEFNFKEFDYVIDCVDTVSAKLEIILKCKEANTKVISSMGTGNHFDPASFIITDISKTSVCPLAKVMRHECKKRGIKKLKVCYTKEEPMELKMETSEELPTGKRSIPGSLVFAPAGAGLKIASEVVKDLINEI